MASGRKKMLLAWHAQPEGASSLTAAADDRGRMLEPKVQRLLGDMGLRIREYVVFYLPKTLVVCSNADAPGYVLYVPYTSVSNWEAKVSAFFKERRTHAEYVEEHALDPAAPVVRELVNVFGGAPVSVKAIDVTYPSSFSVTDAEIECSVLTIGVGGGKVLTVTRGVRCQFLV